VRIPSFLRSSSIRATLLFSLLASAAAIIVLGFVYWSTIGILNRSARSSVDVEITELSRVYASLGSAGVARAIVSRARSSNGRRRLYLLTTPLGHPIAGNLSRWPDGDLEPDNWIEIGVVTPSSGPDVVIPALARIAIFPDGNRLLVGRDLTEQKQFNDLMEEALLIAVGLTIALVVIMGFITVRTLLRRLDLINATASAIFDGALERRVPVLGTDDEFDHLARNLNRMLDRLERLMAEIRDMTDNIAHELRTPLSRLRSRLESTLVAGSTTADYRAAVEKAIVEADDLLETFRVMLEIARIESGVIDETMSTIDLSAIAHDSADLYKAAAEEKGIVFESDCADGIEVAGNRHLISQALANLLDNAIKYTPAGGVVALRCGLTDGRPCCSVSDTGPGIPAKDRERVLERFVRLETSRTSRGAGLGLDLVKVIAELHGAELTLSDNAPGLIATIEFPALLRAGGPANGPRLPVPKRQSSRVRVD
jgi:signal transduction histidine kinase